MRKKEMLKAYFESRLQRAEGELRNCDPESGRTVKLRRTIKKLKSFIRHNNK